MSIQVVTELDVAQMLVLVNNQFKLIYLSNTMSPTSVSTFDMYYGHTMSKILTVHFIKETHAKLLLQKEIKFT